MQIMTTNKNTSYLFRLVIAGFAVAAGNLCAGSPAIEGTVTDTNGRPLSGADVRIEKSGGSSWNKTVRTDSRGHFISDGLVAGGNYRVNLVVSGAVKASINNVVTKAEPTQLNFDLRKNTGSARSGTSKKGKHMVFVPSDTGSHIGGRWVEVDENGKADTTGVNNVQKADGTAIRNFQQTNNSGATGGR